MSLEGSDKRRNQEDPSERGIESNSGGGIELILGRDSFFPPVPVAVTQTTEEQPGEKPENEGYCTLVLPAVVPGRFNDIPVIEIPRVPIIETTYDGFKITMEMAGFIECSPGGIIRHPQMELPPGHVSLGVSSPGDFARHTAVPKDALGNGEITFPGISAEEHSINSLLGWGNYVIFAGGAEEDEGRYVLADLHIKMYKVLQQYPLKRIVQNPLAPYLPTK